MSGCEHYQRRCALMAPCCNKYFACRFCHNDVEDHEMDRTKVTDIRCSQCDKEQKVTSHCVSCGIKFGRYFCKPCCLFDDKEKGQFHCDGCGICRIGGKENYFHCNRCDMCLGIQLKESHKCVEKSSHAPCPVCLEDIHTSRIPAQVPKCGHLIHGTCFKELLNKGSYACPICCVSLIDMKHMWRRLENEIAQTPMPEEYLDYMVSILCRDCQQQSQVTFHVLGLKCAHCGSFNTCRHGEDPTGPPIVARPFQFICLQRRDQVPANVDQNQEVSAEGEGSEAGTGSAAAPDAAAAGVGQDEDEGWETEEEEEVADANDIQLNLLGQDIENINIHQNEESSSAQGN